GAESVAAVPIGGRRAGPRGVLAAYSTRLDRFGVREVRLLATFASLLSSAITKVDLERNAALDGERLVEARQVETRGRQAAQAAGDIDNLLVVIGHRAAGALESDTPAVSRSALHEIGNAAARARELTGGLLGLASPEPAPDVAGGAPTVTALLVGPRDPVTTLAHSTLSEQGFTVIQAEGCVDAERIAARLEDRLDLVVSSVDLPDGTGRALAARLVERQPRPGIVFLSADPAAVGWVDELPSSTVVLLQTPMPTEALARCVHRVLQARPLAA
ncbi:MAG: response regulator, partial [Gaiellales bacterium]